MTISLLYCGVDTLEATFDGELDYTIIPLLEAAKEYAQETDCPEPVTIADLELFVSPKGLGTYRFALADADMQVRLSLARSGIPPVSIRLFAASLATHGHEALYERAVVVASKLGADVENTLSRIDLCLDVQGFEFTDAGYARLVCAAGFRQIVKDGPGVTYQIGKGDVVVRIYRKDAQLKAKKNLSYAKVWEAAPHYDPDLPVWRVEVQLRGSVLKELRARSVRVAFTKLPELFSYGLSWCELRIPTDANKSRWPLDPVWVTLRELWGSSTPAPRIRTAAKAESQERTVARLVGALASLGAHCTQDDPLSVMEYALVVIEQHLAERDIDFSVLVEQRRARLIAEQGVPF